jgi:hypothetical protein
MMFRFTITFRFMTFLFTITFRFDIKFRFTMMFRFTILFARIWAFAVSAANENANNATTTNTIAVAIVLDGFLMFSPPFSPRSFRCYRARSQNAQSKAEFNAEIYARRG